MRIACIVASVPGHRHPGLVDPAGQLLEQLHRLDLVLGGEREADALAHPLVDVVVDALVAVAEDDRAVAHPQVDELVAVDVPDPAALAAIDVDRVLAPRPEVRVRPAGQRPQRALRTCAVWASRRSAGVGRAAGSVAMRVLVWGFGGSVRGTVVARGGTRAGPSCHRLASVVNAILVPDHRVNRTNPAAVTGRDSRETTRRRWTMPGHAGRRRGRP